MISVKSYGNFDKTLKRLQNLSEINKSIYDIANKHAQIALELLRNNTPVDTGKTADSWRYEIRLDNSGNLNLYFLNDNIVDNIPVVILIAYGHATKNGGYVQGNDFITPIMNDIFNNMAENIWKEIRNR